MVKPVEHWFIYRNDWAITSPLKFSRKLEIPYRGNQKDFVWKYNLPFHHLPLHQCGFPSPTHKHAWDTPFCKVIPRKIAIVCVQNTQSLAVVESLLLFSPVDYWSYGQILFNNTGLYWIHLHTSYSRSPTLKLNLEQSESLRDDRLITDCKTWVPWWFSVLGKMDSWNELTQACILPLRIAFSFRRNTNSSTTAVTKKWEIISMVEGAF